MSLYSKMTILEIVNQCDYDYKIKDYITDSVYELTNLSKSTKIYKMSRKTGTNSETIVVVRYLIPTIFKAGRTYDIPVLIYIPKSYPYQAPEVYIERTSKDVQINPNNKEIDANTCRVITKGLYAWSSYSNIPFIIAEVNNCFNAQFPIYSSGSSSSSTSTTRSPNNMNTANYTPNITSTNQGYTNNEMNINLTNQCNLGSTGNVNSFRYNSSDYNQQPNYSNQQVNYQGQGGQEAELQIRQIIAREICDKVFGNIVKEMKKLKSEEERIKIYAEHFKKNCNRYTVAIEQQGHYSRMDTGEIDKEIEEIKASLSENINKKITADNCNEYISEPKETDKQVLKLISIEATLEDVLSVFKKGFERKAIDFGEAVRNIRNISRELTKVKFYRENLIARLYKGNNY